MEVLQENKNATNVIMPEDGVHKVDRPIKTVTSTPLRVKRLKPEAVLPKRGSFRAAGYDIARYIHISLCLVQIIFYWVRCCLYLLFARAFVG